MKKIVVAIALFANVFLVNAQTDLAKKMAETIMLEYTDSLVVKEYNNPNTNNPKMAVTAVPDKKNRNAKWDYEIGVVLQGFQRLYTTTGDKRYFDYIKKIMDHFIEKDGSIRTYVEEDFNIDNIPPGRQLIFLYEQTKENKYLLASQKIHHQWQWQPRTNEGGFWHKLRYPYQMWLDGLYMGQPFAAEYAVLTKDNNTFDDIANQFIWMENHARDSATGLLYHGWDESRIQRWANPQTGKSPEFWSRAMGWYIMALVDVLEVFPVNHPKRAELTAILERLTIALGKYQDSKSKVWYQVTDKGHVEGNYLESSSSSMFVAAIFKAVRLKFLNEKYLPIASQGYDGILKEFIVKDEKGIYHLTKAVAGAGLGGNPYRDGSFAYYIHEPLRDNDLKAVGPFMQAAIEKSLLEK